MIQVDINQCNVDIKSKGKNRECHKIALSRKLSFNILVH